MSSISAQVVLATAMAVSGTLIILSLFREKPLSPTQLSGNQDSHQEKNILRSCLSSTEGKKRERKKKRVKFADDVKDSSWKGKEYRKDQRKSTEILDSCGEEIRRNRFTPANRVALYSKILRGRVQRMEYSC